MNRLLGPLALPFRYFDSRLKKGPGLQSSLYLSSSTRDRKDGRIQLPRRLHYTHTHILSRRQDRLSRGKEFADVPGTVSKVSADSVVARRRAPDPKQPRSSSARESAPFSSGRGNPRLAGPGGHDGSGVAFAQSGGGGLGLWGEASQFVEEP